MRYVGTILLLAFFFLFAFRAISSYRADMRNFSRPDLLEKSRKFDLMISNIRRLDYELGYSEYEACWLKEHWWYAQDPEHRRLTIYWNPLTSSFEEEKANDRRNHQDESAPRHGRLARNHSPAASGAEADTDADAV